MVAQPHPPVLLVQVVERRPETVDGQLFVSWLESHLLVSFNTQRYSFFVKQKKKRCYKCLIFNKLYSNRRTLIINNDTIFISTVNVYHKHNSVNMVSENVVNSNQI